MLAQYDSFGSFETPQITLCNPDGRALGILSNLSDRRLNVRFNDLSDLSFTIQRGEKGCRCPVYELVEPFRYLLLEGIGYFVITDVSETDEAGAAAKAVEASSCEYELNNIQLGYYEGTYRFYSDGASEPKDSLLSDIMKRLPSWRLDTASIPNEVAKRCRTFDTTDQTVYSFLMTELEEAYECLFEFDIQERVIRVYDRYSYDNRTDICLSTEDALDSLTLRTKSDEIKTALLVRGGNELDILSVNPLGTNLIYDFSYYATEAWMEPALIAKVRQWQANIDALVDAQGGAFQEKRAEIRVLQEEKSACEGTIITLKQEILNLQVQQSAIISEAAEQAQKNEALASLREQINAKQAALHTAEAQLADTEASLAQANSELAAIQQAVRLERVFTPAEMEVLSRFIQQGAYTEDTITKQDNMSYTEVQAQALELYHKARGLLKTISTPRFEYAVETGSFLFQKEFAHLTNRLNTGCLIDIRLSEDDIASLLLLEMAVDYDGRSLSLTFGNRFKLSDPSALFNDLVGGSIAKTASTVEYLRSTFDFKQQRSALDELKKLKDESINLTHNMLINADNQVMTIDASGISGRRAELGDDGQPTGEYEPEVLKITNNAIAFSTDDFESTETVLGKNLLPDGVTTDDGKNYLYGLNAKLLMGDLIIGDRLKVSGEIEGRLINAKGLTVNNGTTDTLRVDENGDVSLNVKSLSIEGSQAATQGDINSLQIGSRNYIKDSVSRVLTSSGGDQYTHMQLCTLEQGAQYTFSVEKIVRAAGTATQVALLIYDFPNNHPVSTRYLSVSDSKQQITFTAPSDGDTNTLIIYAGINGSTSGNTIRYEKMKLEKGSKATDWTPAPDDPTYGVNMILGDSKKEVTSNLYGFGRKELSAQLIYGQKYTLSFSGKIDQQAKDDGKCLRCYIYSSDWTTSYNTALDTTYSSQASLTFVASKTSTCYFQPYMHPDGGSRAGKATLHWCKLEVGDRATDWSPAPEDRAYLVNTLSPTQADGMWLGSDGKLNITATQIKAGKLQSKDGSSYFDLESGELYSKYAKMNGKFFSSGQTVSATLGNVDNTSATPGQVLVFHSPNLDPMDNPVDLVLNSFGYIGVLTSNASSVTDPLSIFARTSLDITSIDGGIEFTCFNGGKLTFNAATPPAAWNKQIYHAANLQCGEVLVPNGTKGSDGIYTGSTTIYFSPAFAKTPRIVATARTADPLKVSASIGAPPTANSAVITVKRTSTTSDGYTAVHWIAVEPN